MQIPIMIQQQKYGRNSTEAEEEGSFLRVIQVVVKTTFAERQSFGLR